MRDNRTCTWISCLHSIWHARISPKIVIISACARPFASAAVQAGYQVAAFDIFNDVETRRCCFYSARVKFHGGGFDAEDLLSQLASAKVDGVPILYGSGLENRIELLEDLSQRTHLLGNMPGTVASIKNPRTFFPALDQLGIPHPETVFDFPFEPAGWLCKYTGGSGGTHIHRCDGRAADYFQKEQPGMAVSLLFLANGREIDCIGFNELLTSPTDAMPFRYGGVVSNVILPGKVKLQMQSYAASITRTFGLVGLNSLDCIVDAEERAHVLEINPRLSASFELYETFDLLTRHIQACNGEMPAPGNIKGKAKAIRVCYAVRDIQVPEFMQWPLWATDLPNPGDKIPAGHPVCSAMASAGTASEAKELAFARGRQIDAKWQPI